MREYVNKHTVMLYWLWCVYIYTLPGSSFINDLFDKKQLEILTETIKNSFQGFLLNLFHLNILVL